MADPFKLLTAPAAPYDPVDVDTDQIIPARFLKIPRGEGYGRFLFHDVRFRADGSEVNDFILNKLPYRDARILVANNNFGCGSSREAAPYALYDSGFRCVIAPSFGDIFFNNCLKNGIVPARLPPNVCADLRRHLTEKPGAELTVDLEALEVRDGTSVYAFHIDAFFLEMILKGVDEVDFTRSLMPQIEAFEKAYAAAAPWAVR